MRFETFVVAFILVAACLAAPMLRYFLWLRIPERWWVLVFVRDGWAELPVGELGPRPGFAQPDGGDPYTPWISSMAHLHFADNGAVSGAHVKARTFNDAVSSAKALVREYDQDMAWYRVTG